MERGREKHGQGKKLKRGKREVEAAEGQVKGEWKGSEGEMGRRRRWKGKW